jgi:hypothetical protein
MFLGSLDDSPKGYLTTSVLAAEDKLGVTCAAIKRSPQTVPDILGKWESENLLARPAFSLGILYQVPPDPA